MATTLQEASTEVASQPADKPVDSEQPQGEAQAEPSNIVMADAPTAKSGEDDAQDETGGEEQLKETPAEAVAAPRRRGRKPKVKRQVNEAKKAATEVSAAEGEQSLVGDENGGERMDESGAPEQSTLAKAPRKRGRRSADGLDSTAVLESSNAAASSTRYSLRKRTKPDDTGSQRDDSERITTKKGDGSSDSDQSSDEADDETFDPRRLLERRGAAADIYDFDKQSLFSGQTGRLRRSIGQFQTQTPPPLRKSNVPRANGESAAASSKANAEAERSAQVRIDEELGPKCTAESDRAMLEHFAQSGANRREFDAFYFDFLRKSRLELLQRPDAPEVHAESFNHLLSYLRQCEAQSLHTLDTVCLFSEHPPSAHDFFDKHVFEFQAPPDAEGDGEETQQLQPHRLSIAYKLSAAQRETLFDREGNALDCYAVDQRTFRRLQDRSMRRATFFVTQVDTGKLVALLDCRVESSKTEVVDLEDAAGSAVPVAAVGGAGDTVPKTGKLHKTATRSTPLKYASVVQLTAFRQHTLFLVLAAESRSGRPRYTIVAVVDRSWLDSDTKAKEKEKEKEKVVTDVDADEEEQHAKCSCSLVTNDDEYETLVSAVRSHEEARRARGDLPDASTVTLEFEQSQLVDESGKPILELALSIVDSDAVTPRRAEELVGVYYESGNAITIPFVRTSALRLDRLGVANSNDAEASFEVGVPDSFLFDEFVAKECKIVQEATVRVVQRTQSESDRQVLVDQVKVRCFAHATPERWNEFRCALARSFLDTIREEPLALSAFEFLTARWLAKLPESPSHCAVCATTVEHLDELNAHELAHLRKALGPSNTASERAPWKSSRARANTDDDFDELFGDDDIKLRASLSGTSRQRNLPQLFECEACSDFFSNAAAYADHCLQCDSVSLFAKLVAKISPAGEVGTALVPGAVSTPFQRTIKKSTIRPAAAGSSTVLNSAADDGFDVKHSDDRFELFNLDDHDAIKLQTSAALTPGGSKKQFVCGLCGTQLSTRHKLRQHFLFIHQQCALCLATYASVDDLSAHLQTHYPGTKHKRVLQCEVCVQFYSLNRQNLIHHHFYAHPDAIGTLRQLVLANVKAGEDQEVVGESPSQPQSQPRRAHAVAKKGQARKLQEAQSSVDLRDSYYDSSFGKEKMECRHCAQKFACSQTVDYIKHLQAKHAVLNNAANPIQICRICFDYFHSVELLSEHLRLIHVPSGLFKNAGVQTIYECDVCQPPTSFFAFLKQIYQHYFDAHGVGEPRLFRCHLCPKRFHLRKILRSHIERHSEETRYECDFCEKRFAARANLLIHRQIHAEARAVAYVDADKPKRSASARADDDPDFDEPAMLALGDSTTRRGKLKKFECDHCRKRFAHLKNLQQHLMETHMQDSNAAGANMDDDASVDADFEDVKPMGENETSTLGANNSAGADVSASQKRSSTGKQSKMVVHVPIAQPPVGYHSTQMVSGAVLAGAAWNVSPLTVVKREHVCETCTKTFNSMRELARHCKVQHSGPITCEHCSRTFTNLTMYDAHRKLHTDPPRFICDYCQAEYFEKAALIKHIRAEHLRLEPERRECPICRKQVSQLRMHLATHDAPRFECARCGRRFTKSAYYNEHLRTHLDDAARPFACGHCARTFNKKSNLNLHMRRVHPHVEQPFDDAEPDSDLKLDHEALFSDPLENGTANGDKAVPAVPRKRGRPKRIRETQQEAPSDAAGNTQQPPHDEEPADLAEPTPTASSSAPKRGRGRPAKHPPRPVESPAIGATANAGPNKVMPSRASKSRAQEKITQSFIDETDRDRAGQAAVLTDAAAFSPALELQSVELEPQLEELADAAGAVDAAAADDAAAGGEEQLPPVSASVPATE